MIPIDAAPTALILIAAWVFLYPLYTLSTACVALDLRLTPVYDKGHQLPWVKHFGPRHRRLNRAERRVGEIDTTMATRPSVQCH